MENLNLKNLVVICDERLGNSKFIMTQNHYDNYLIECNDQWKSDSDDPDNYTPEYDFEVYGVLDYFEIYGDNSLDRELEIYYYNKMKKWKLEIEIDVSQNWIDDGFDLSERQEEIEELLRSMLPYAYEHEMEIKIGIKEN